MIGQMLIPSLVFARIALSSYTGGLWLSFSWRVFKWCAWWWLTFLGFFPPPHVTLVLFLFQSMCLSDHCSLRRLRGLTCCHYHCHILTRKCHLQSRCCDPGCCGRTLDNVISVTEWDVETGEVYFEIQWAWSRTHSSSDHVAKFFHMVTLWNLPLNPQWTISVIGVKCLWVSAVVPPPSRFKEDVVGNVFFEKMYQVGTFLFLQDLSLGKLLQWNKLSGVCAAVVSIILVTKSMHLSHHLHLGVTFSWMGDPVPLCCFFFTKDIFIKFPSWVWPLTAKLSSPADFQSAV